MAANTNTAEVVSGGNFDIRLLKIENFLKYTLSDVKESLKKYGLSEFAFDLNNDGRVNVLDTVKFSSNL